MEKIEEKEEERVVMSIRKIEGGLKNSGGICKWVYREEDKKAEKVDGERERKESAATSMREPGKREKKQVKKRKTVEENQKTKRLTGMDGNSWKR